MRAWALVACLVAGCGGVARVAPGAPQGGSFATSWTGDRCQRLLDQRDATVWAAAFLGGLAGVSGLSAVLPDGDSAEERQARLGLGISTAVVAAAATSMTVLAKAKSSEFEAYCNQVPEPEEAAGADPIEVPVEVVGVVLPDGGLEERP